MHTLVLVAVINNNGKWILTVTAQSNLSLPCLSHRRNPLQPVQRRIPSPLKRTQGNTSLSQPPNLRIGWALASPGKTMIRSLSPLWITTLTTPWLCRLAFLGRECINAYECCVMSLSHSHITTQNTGSTTVFLNHQHINCAVSVDYLMSVYLFIGKIMYCILYCYNVHDRLKIWDQ